MVFDAVMRNLEIIGEASRYIPEEVHVKHPEIEWRKIIALRNIVVHEYFGIDLDIIWDLVENKIPELLEQVRAIRQDEE